MKKCIFKGVATALATPFSENGINITEFEKFINFQIDSGINALVVCGTTGEASTMSKEEKDITAYISNVIFEDKGYDESYIHQNNETEKKCSEILNNEILKNTKGRSSR